jgi:hypothetical protein
MADESSRRRFIRGAAAASAAVGGAVGVSPIPAQQAGRIRGFDHVALPMEHTGAMLDVIESATAFIVLPVGKTRLSRIELLPQCRLAGTFASCGRVRPSP